MTWPEAVFRSILAIVGGGVIIVAGLALSGFEFELTKKNKDEEKGDRQ